MTEYSKVFLDTTPLIYFLDADENFGERTRLILEEILTSGRMVVSSVITCMEYLVYPYRTGNRQKIDAFLNLLRTVELSCMGSTKQSPEKPHRYAPSTRTSRRWTRFNWLQLSATGATLS